MRLIWKNKLFWREETHNNKLYLHPILAFVSITTVIVIGLVIITLRPF